MEGGRESETARARARGRGAKRRELLTLAHTPGGGGRATLGEAAGSGLLGGCCPCGGASPIACSALPRLSDTCLSLSLSRSLSCTLSFDASGSTPLSDRVPGGATGAWCSGEARLRVGDLRYGTCARALSRSEYTVIIMRWVFLTKCVCVCVRVCVCVQCVVRVVGKAANLRRIW